MMYCAMDILRATLWMLGIFLVCSRTVTQHHLGIPKTIVDARINGRIEQTSMRSRRMRTTKLDRGSEEEYYEDDEVSDENEN